MKKFIPKVAIIGRTNVGKSTLFNQIVGRKLAIVEDAPGVTRDRAYAMVNSQGFTFNLIDTGGLLGDTKDEFQDEITKQAQIAISQADIILVLFDGKVGVHPLDREIVKSLYGIKKPIIYLVNKCEKQDDQYGANDFYKLGIEKFFCISAAHNVGVREVVAEIKTYFDKKILENENIVDDSIRVAIVGKPNAGKSTLINLLCGENRVITSDISGTTRDSIEVNVKVNGQDYILVDTAGLRKKAKVKDDTIEEYGTIRSIEALSNADVAILLLDASLDKVATEQDQKIAGLIHDRGIPFIIAANKWDLVEKDHKTVKEFERNIYDIFKFARYAPIIYISAKDGKRCSKLLPKAKEVYENARHRITTAALNKVINTAFEKRPPTPYRGQVIKVYFSTQIQVAPPTFVVFVNHPKSLHFSYLRYLKNEIRNEFAFEGSNIKVIVRKRNENEEDAS
ncbi:MAG: ribosome biogenesis GTPase Der [Bdellovibrionota bacterium]|nr:ribosome biogenesis GTPase Der [Pseudomonadota bacterium]MDY6090075.1 ribosome biogenesis GTPase Der [Bdellovibrionota bacterium]